MDEVNDCRRCRHHSKQPRARPTGWQEGAHFELDDRENNATAYHCGAPTGPHAGAEVGLEPVTCESFSAGTLTPIVSTLQSAYEAFLARQAARALRDKEG